MNTPYFIAKRVISNPSHSFSRLIIKIAIITTALGMTVMIVASSLIAGFKMEISNKIFGFWGHIHIMDFEATSTSSYESVPVSINQDFYPDIVEVPDFQYPRARRVGLFGMDLYEDVVSSRTNGGVAHIQTFSQKIGVIKTKEEIEGIILKGMGPDYDWGMMRDFIKLGGELDLGGEKADKGIIISEQTAKRLEVDTGSYFLVYFVKGNNQIKKRFQVKGIYKTGLEEYDTRFALIDQRHIQKINGWDSTEVSGFELFVEDIDDLHPIRDAVYDRLPMNLYAKTIEDVDPNIFSWLDLQDTNEKVILILMVIVGWLSMITALIVLILEHTRKVGVLKALGADNWTVQRIFLYYGAYITVVGLLWGNAMGIGFCILQDWLGFIQLPEEDYYVAQAPIHLRPLYIIFLNLGVLVVTVLILVIPSILVRYITPVKAIRFD